MATTKQTAANRMNAQNSSGPRTTAGKATSRFNAVKHGIYAVHQIMFDEKPEDLAELAAEYHEHHRPADADQRFLVDTLVHNEWRIRRTRRVEANLWYHAYDAFVVKNIDVTLTCTSGDAFATDSYTFERLQRIVNSCERVYHRALKELQRLQEVGQAFPPANPDPHSQPAAPAEPAPAPQPQQSTPSSANLGSFRQKPQTAAPAAPKPPVVNHVVRPDAPSAGSLAGQPTPANPAETHPPAADCDPRPPEAA